MTDNTVEDATPLSEEARAIMDRAVRAARKYNWCTEFSRVASKIFGIPISEVVDSEGFDCVGYDKEGFGIDGYNRDGFDREGFNSSGYDWDGYNRDGYNRYGLNREGFDAQGKDKYRFDSYGFDPEGYDYSGSRRRTNRKWYDEQAAKPDTDFRFDSRGLERATASEKKTLKEMIGF